MKKPLPELRIGLRHSRLADAFAGTLVLAALLTLPLPGLSTGLRAALCLLVLALVIDARRAGRRSGVRELLFDGEDRLSVRDAGGGLRRVCRAGHAQLGSLAVFVFVAREGWRRFLFGNERITVWRDAVDAADFRRLRARLRMA